MHYESCLLMAIFPKTHEDQCSLNVSCLYPHNALGRSTSLKGIFPNTQESLYCFEVSWSNFTKASNFSSKSVLCFIGLSTLSIGVVSLIILAGSPQLSLLGQ